MRRSGGFADWPEVPGRGDMAKKVGSDQPGGEEGSGDSAKRIADEIGPLIRLARSRGFDFLAYLLAMALKEAWRLAGHRTYTQAPMRSLRLYSPRGGATEARLGNAEDA